MRVRVIRTVEVDVEPVYGDTPDTILAKGVELARAVDWDSESVEDAARIPDDDESTAHDNDEEI